MKLEDLKPGDRVTYHEQVAPFRWEDYPCEVVSVHPKTQRVTIKTEGKYSKVKTVRASRIYAIKDPK